jgi:hypothetical protein
MARSATLDVLDTSVRIAHGNLETIGRRRGDRAHAFRRRYLGDCDEVADEAVVRPTASW